MGNRWQLMLTTWPQAELAFAGALYRWLPINAISRSRASPEDLHRLQQWGTASNLRVRYIDLQSRVEEMRAKRCWPVLEAWILSDDEIWKEPPGERQVDSVLPTHAWLEGSYIQIEGSLRWQGLYSVHPRDGPCHQVRRVVFPARRRLHRVSLQSAIAFIDGSTLPVETLVVKRNS